MFYVMPPRGVFDHHDHWSLGHGYPSGCRAQALSCGMPHAYYRSRASMPSWPSPSIRSIRNTDGVILVIDLPGFSRAKDSISVEIEDKLLTITAKKAEKAQACGGPCGRGRCFMPGAGNFSRSLRLGPNINTDAVSAVFQRGVLTVTLPYKQECNAPGPRRIEVEGPANSPEPEGTDDAHPMDPKDTNDGPGPSGTRPHQSQDWVEVEAEEAEKEGEEGELPISSRQGKEPLSPRSAAAKEDTFHPEFDGSVEECEY